jgi:ATP-dependent DNA helicase RecG
MDDLRAGRAISRHYRNRRIGDFLKEIEMSEKRSTGITKILRTLQSNGSPPPEFETNDGRDYMIVTIHQHDGFKAGGVINGVINEVINGVKNGTIDRQAQIIDAIKEYPSITKKQLEEKTGISKSSLDRDLTILKQKNVIKRVGSKKSGYWKVIEKENEIEGDDE